MQITHSHKHWYCLKRNSRCFYLLGLMSPQHLSTTECLKPPFTQINKVSVWKQYLQVLLTRQVIESIVLFINEPRFTGKYILKMSYRSIKLLKGQVHHNRIAAFFPYISDMQLLVITKQPYMISVMMIVEYYADGMQHIESVYISL